MPTNTFNRLSGLFGLIGVALLLVAVARRAGLVPENTLTHALAPPASALLLLTLVGLYRWRSDRLGTLGLVGFAVNFFGLAGLFAIEFTTHAVFPSLDADTRNAVLAGPARGYFLTVALLFLAGVLLFGTALWRARIFPAWAVVLYMIGFGPAALRGLVPDAVYLGGLVVGGIGTIGLSLVLWQATTRDSNGGADPADRDRIPVQES